MLNHRTRLGALTAFYINHRRNNPTRPPLGLSKRNSFLPEGYHYYEHFDEFRNADAVESI